MITPPNQPLRHRVGLFVYTTFFFFSPCKVCDPPTRSFAFLISFLSIFWFLEREFDIYGKPIRIFAHRMFGIGGWGVGCGVTVVL